MGGREGKLEVSGTRLEHPGRPTSRLTTGLDHLSTTRRPGRARGGVSSGTAGEAIERYSEPRTELLRRCRTLISRKGIGLVDTRVSGEGSIRNLLGSETFTQNIDSLEGENRVGIGDRGHSRSGGVMTTRP